MSAQPIPEAQWDAYRIRPRRDALLEEREDGSLVLIAEAEYLVDLPPDAKERAWQALDVLDSGRALLRFGNFIGESSLGGKRLHVTSNRLRPHEVEAMLDDVMGALHSLPFYFETPTELAYARDVFAADDVDYQAYVFLAHALQGTGTHNLPGAFDRILARPQMRLISTLAMVPLAQADRVDADTLLGLARGISPLRPIPAESPFAGSPVAIALGGRAPESVRAGRMVETTNTPENQFIVAVLEVADRMVDRFEQEVRREYPLRAERHLQETAEYRTLLGRWRRHPALAEVPPAKRLAMNSTILRGRAGYRQVTRFFVDLQARTRLLDADDAKQLLEVRDAALLYEYWCYFQVVDAVAALLNSQPAPAAFRYGSFGSTLQHAYAADFGRVRVWFNLDFRKPRSYSVPLRPDITLELDDGTLHLFDAKLKREPIPASKTSDAAIEEEEQRATYRRGDLYKMHTYRDALGARSVWALFPGRNVERVHFAPEGPDEGAAPAGVGALPLLPGSEGDRAELRAVVGAMLEQSRG
jgi:uncharacterized protein